MPTPSKLEPANGSRIVGLPGREATVRSLSSVTLLVVDEASEVADDLYRSLRPMLAVNNGRLVLMSAPSGSARPPSTPASGPGGCGSTVPAAPT
jgi:hypothetical protein